MLLESLPKSLLISESGNEPRRRIFNNVRGRRVIDAVTSQSPRSLPAGPDVRLPRVRHPIGSGRHFDRNERTPARRRKVRGDVDDDVARSLVGRAVDVVAGNRVASGPELTPELRDPWVVLHAARGNNDSEAGPCLHFGLRGDIPQGWVHTTIHVVMHPQSGLRENQLLASQKGHFAQDGSVRPVVDLHRDIARGRGVVVADVQMLDVDVVPAGDAASVNDLRRRRGGDRGERSQVGRGLHDRRRRAVDLHRRQMNFNVGSSTGDQLQVVGVCS